MSNLEPELDQLKRDLLYMMELDRNQLAKSKEAMEGFDLDLAKEVLANEKRVNGLELKIDRDCENILALYNPVAVDLRFVLAALKINHDLERIGDHADSIAQFLTDSNKKLDDNILKEFNTTEMFDNAVSMLEFAYKALDKEDTRMARKVFKKDDFLNENNRKAAGIAIELIGKNPEKAEIVLPVVAIVRKLERVGDLAKNLAEEVIFYIDAKVLKHKKKT